MKAYDMQQKVNGSLRYRLSTELMKLVLTNRPKRFYHIILNNRSRNKHPCQIDHVLEQNWASDFTGQEAILM